MIVSGFTFSTYAGRSLPRWSALVGSIARHRVHGQGQVIELTSDGRHVTAVVLMYSELDHFRHTLPIARFGRDIAYVNFAGDDDTTRALKVLTTQAAPGFTSGQSRRLQTNRWQQLLAKYGLSEGQVDLFDADHLSTLLVEIDRSVPLSAANRMWLEQRRLFQPLAMENENRFSRDGDVWDAVRACKYWRSAGKPDRAVALSNEVMVSPEFDRSTAAAKAALLTTSAASYREIGDLVSAELGALKARRLNPRSFYPCNLLGALYIQIGMTELGLDFFNLARELGASDAIVRQQLSAALDASAHEEELETRKRAFRLEDSKYSWAHQLLRMREKTR